MKRFILIPVLFLLPLLSFAQKVQFSNPTNTWSFIDSTTGCCIPIAIAYTTTNYDSTQAMTYNGYNYQYISSSVASFYVREDSAGKVYAIGGSDSIERVLYDFNAAIGDTMNYIYPTDTLIAWVSSIDSTQFGGLWYKVWHYDGQDHSSYYADSIRPYQYNVIEGMGCPNGLYYPVSPYSLISFSQQLLCFSNNMGITSALSKAVPTYGNDYTGRYDNDSSCYLFYNHPPTPGIFTAVSQPLSQSGNVLVVPDPVRQAGSLVFPYSIASGTVVILNELGQSVANISLNGNTELEIGDKIKVPGMYYYRVTDNEKGKVFSGKFVSQ